MTDTGNKLILAPMAGFTDQPFRRVCKLFGADEVVTELLSANAIIRDSEKTFKMAGIHPDEKPAVIQIFGSDPSVMADAAVRVESLGCTSIDINMGCPAKKVRKNGAGSALLDNPKNAIAIARAVVEAVKLPVSIKIRTGRVYGDRSGMEIALGAAEYGVSRVTVHARTVEGGFTSPVDFAFAAELKKRLGGIEVIGNGGIFSVVDAAEWIEKTGVDGLMIGRGSLGRPSIFKAIKNGLPAIPGEEIETILTHCRWIEEFYGAYTAVGQARGHLMYYVKGHPNAKRLRNEILNAESIAEICSIIRGYAEVAAVSAA